MADDSMYQKMAKSGWLGTKAQISAQYGNPVWGADNSGNNDSMSEALKRAAAKRQTQQSQTSGG